MQIGNFRCTFLMHLLNPIASTSRSPRGFTLENTPQAQTVRIGYAGYQNLAQFDGKQLVTQRILQVNGIFFKLELYPEVKDFFGKVQAGDEQQAVLIGGSVNAQKVD